jgi:hypothetical protein
MSGYFETPLGPNNPQLSGRINSVVVEERGGEAVKPTQIIRIDSDWSVYVEWELVGHLSKMICGKWCLHVRLESMGPGPELKLPVGYNHELPLDPCGKGEYKYLFRFPKGTVPADACSTPYKLVVTITYHNACGKAGPIAGFYEGPIIQFYDAD